MAYEHKRRVTTDRPRVAKPWLVVDDRFVRAYDVNTGAITREQLFAVMVLWDVPGRDPTTWIGWLTTTNHRSACFCAADLEHVSFRQWLASLPGWEPARLVDALAQPGMHVVWRRYVD